MVSRRTLSLIALITATAFSSSGSPSSSHALAGEAVDRPSLQIAAPTDAFPHGTGTYLTCKDIRKRIREFLRVHYAFETFSDELSSRTFEMFFRLMDPGKMYYLANDIEGLRKYQNLLPREVARGRCDFIYEAYNLMLKRMDEAHLMAEDLLKKPFDYSLDEEIETDRTKVAWAANSAELRERWRKTLKFIYMGLIETDPDQTAARSRLLKRYTRFRKNFVERSTDEAHATLLNAFAASLDPHSDYLKPRDQDDFKISFALKLVGIGASLTQRDGYTIVDSIIPGGAAARDGRLLKEDKIIAVDPGTGEPVVDVVDMDLSKVVQYIRGKKGTTVTLTILRKDPAGDVNRLSLSLVRDVVKFADGQAKSDVLTLGDKKIGVINLPTFYLDYDGSRDATNDFRSSARDIAREVIALNEKKVDGIILDLRSNGGGDLGECIRITGLFIEDGPIVQIQERDRRVSSQADLSPGALYKGPMALLINKQSASASEIIAGALQDYGRAIIVGNSRTYGKGTVQNVIDIPGQGERPSDGSLKVTISKFFRPSGKSNQEIGVPADVVIPSVLDVFDFSEAKQDYVLKTSTIPPHKDFQPLRNFSEVTEELTQKSAQRIKENKEWKQVFESIAEAEKEKGSTLLSLKKAQTKTEAQKNDKSTQDGETQKQTHQSTSSTSEAEAAATAADSSASASRGQEDDDRRVVRPEDLELHEAAAILKDAMDMVGTPNWLQKTAWKKKTVPEQK